MDLYLENLGGLQFKKKKHPVQKLINHRKFVIFFSGFEFFVKFIMTFFFKVLRALLTSKNGIKRDTTPFTYFRLN